MAQTSEANQVTTDKKVALITGITGQVRGVSGCLGYLIIKKCFQDGSYLAEFLIAKGYEVHGLIRRASTFNTGRIQHLYRDPLTHTEGCNVSFSLPVYSAQILSCY